jgi:hypothetical protein
MNLLHSRESIHGGLKALKKLSSYLFVSQSHLFKPLQHVCIVLILPRLVCHLYSLLHLVESLSQHLCKVATHSIYPLLQLFNLFILLLFNI